MWVKLAGGETGPTLETRVLPDPETTTPIIDNITPTDISPGQSFIIRGRNLAKYRVDRARVRLLFPDGSSVQTTIQDPQRELILAKIPDDFGGMQRTICRLEVTNDYGRKAEQTVTFVPAEEIVAAVVERIETVLFAAPPPALPGLALAASAAPRRPPGPPRALVPRSPTLPPGPLPRRSADRPPRRAFGPGLGPPLHSGPGLHERPAKSAGSYPLGRR